MTALLRKELRLLAPATIVAVVAAALFAVWPDSRAQPMFLREVRGLMLALGYTITIASLATASFGREIGDNTLASLLALPVRRAAMWHAKALSLGPALALACFAWWLSLTLYPLSLHTGGERAHAGVWLALIALCAFAGGLCVPLLVRQSTAAFWLIIIVPVGVAVAASTLWRLCGLRAGEGLVMAGAVTTYSLASVLWSYRLWHRVEDYQAMVRPASGPAWIGSIVSIGGRARTPGQTRSPWRALVAKELRFFQPIIMLGALLAVVHLGVAVTRAVVGDFRTHSLAELVSSEFWHLWFLMPLLLGAMAVSDERRYGTIPAQLCLSVRRRTQFLVKLGVALVFAILLGAIAPALIEDGRILPDVDDMSDKARTHLIVSPYLALLRSLGPAGPIVALLPVPLLLFACGFYASTLTRNVLRALGLAVVLAAGAGVYVAKIRSIENPSVEWLWQGPLIHLILVPSVFIAVVSLAFHNSTTLSISWRQVARNIGTLAATILAALTVTTAIYQRCWELIVPGEPIHGPGRIPANGVRAIDSASPGVTVRLTDGHLWVQGIALETPESRNRYLNSRRVSLDAGGGPLPPGRWSAVAGFPGTLFALNETGETWVSATAVPAEIAQGRPRLDPPGHVPLIRYDDSTTWLDIQTAIDVVLAVKADGSLWRMCVATLSKEETPTVHFDLTPLLLDASHTWTGLDGDGWRAHVQMSDGTNYVYPPHSASLKNSETLQFAGLRAPLQRVDTNVSRRESMTQVWTAPPGSRFASLHVSLDQNGGLTTTPVEAKGSHRTMVQLDRTSLSAHTRFIAVAFDRHTLVTLSQDGTLRQWRFPRTGSEAVDAAVAKSTRLGRNSDWVALHGTRNGVLTLAADGTLWFWEFPAVDSRANRRALMRVSRKPQFVASIFEVTR